MTGSIQNAGESSHPVSLVAEDLLWNKVEIGRSRPFNPSPRTFFYPFLPRVSHSSNSSNERLKTDSMASMSCNRPDGMALLYLLVAHFLDGPSIYR
jgi:hypothetical protein